MTVNIQDWQCNQWMTLEKDTLKKGLLNTLGVFSNAVIEHVGSASDQLVFLNEMLRVGKNVFFTTPNKWFPIESHTNVFLRHWFDEHFYKWCKLNQPCWSVNNLLLLGIEDLHKIMKQSNAGNYKIKSNRTLGWPMTFTIVCSWT